MLNIRQRPRIRALRLRRLSLASLLPLIAQTLAFQILSTSSCCQTGTYTTIEHCLVSLAPTQVPRPITPTVVQRAHHSRLIFTKAKAYCVLSSSRLISTRQPNKLPARLTSCCKRAQPYHPSLSLCKLVKATNHSIALRVHISNKSRRHKKGKTSHSLLSQKKKNFTQQRSPHSLRVIVAWKYLLSRHCGAGRRQCVTAAVFSVPRNLRSPDSAFGCRLLIKSRHLRPSHSPFSYFFLPSPLRRKLHILLVFYFNHRFFSRSRQQPLRLNSATNSESRATYTKSALYLTHP